jgi:cytochrome oxidase Cu insertion factor (SCO1/SenC/PrrC family)
MSQGSVRIRRNSIVRLARSPTPCPALLVLVMALAALAQAQPSFGVPSNQPPNEDFYVYKQIPDIALQTGGSRVTRLSEIWSDKPLLLTMVFTRCAGVCSPFLRSLRVAASAAHDLGQDYRIVVLSFDPRDTVNDMEMAAQNLGVQLDPNWIFGISSAASIARVAAASGFWFQWDPSAQQYDHPSLVDAIDHGRVVRMLAGTSVSPASLREVIQELRGSFVASYALAGKVAFRCFEYDPIRDAYRLDWGLLFMLLPATCAVLAVIWAFFLNNSEGHIWRSHGKDSAYPAAG